MVALLAACYVGDNPHPQLSRRRVSNGGRDGRLCARVHWLCRSSNSGVRGDIYQRVTGTAITYGVLVSFVGLLVMFGAIYYVLSSQWSGQLIDFDGPGSLFSYRRFF